jgi:hypothetical protein
MATTPTSGWSESGSWQWLAPAEAIVLANVTGKRQVPLDFGTGHEPDVAANADAILRVIEGKAPRCRPTRTMTDGLRSLQLYPGGRLT